MEINTERASDCVSVCGLIHFICMTKAERFYDSKTNRHEYNYKPRRFFLLPSEQRSKIDTLA